MLKTGMIIGDRYEIIEKIGSGGMSFVYKGKDIKLERNVAIKVLKNEYREDKNFVRKFKEEAQAAASLAHPNIVNVYDVGEEQGIHYIVMELVEGITLKNYIERKGKLSVRDAINIAISVSKGLEVAHNNDIVHRDIKPQNIMISKEGKVKIMDFGIAKAASSETIASNAMGSVHYTSPEQARGGYSDAKSDIYSLGIVMFEMVTGRVPFDGESTVAVAVKHLQEELPSPRMYCPELPISLEQIIYKCTEKIAARRYTNMEEFVSDLKQSVQTPDADFVKRVVVDETAKTVTISKKELGDIKKGAGYVIVGETAGASVGEEKPFVEEPKAEKKSEIQEEEKPVTEDVSEDSEEDPEDEIDPRLEKIMTIGGIVAAIIILIIIFMLAGKVFGMFGGGGEKEPHQVEQTEDMLTMIDVRGMTWEEAKDALNQMGLGITSAGKEESEEYEDGQIMRQSVAPEEAVAKNTTIEVVIAVNAVKMVKIPDVTGDSQADAVYRLEQEGFVTNIQETFDEEIAEGNVVKMSPAEGTEVAEGSTIVLYISKGPDIVYTTVPNVVGKTKEEAEKAMDDKNLSVTATEEYSDEVEAGIVIRQSKSSGSEVAEGTVINIVVSKGQEKVTVPELIGRTLERAQEKLSAAGLKAEVEKEYSDKPKGEVISCEPGQGAAVEKGSTVKIVVSDGPEPTPEPTKAPTKEPTPEPTKAPVAEPTKVPTEMPTQNETQDNTTTENTDNGGTAPEGDAAAQ